MGRRRSPLLRASLGALAGLAAGRVAFVALAPVGPSRPSVPLKAAELPAAAAGSVSEPLAGAVLAGGLANGLSLLLAAFGSVVLGGGGRPRTGPPQGGARQPGPARRRRAQTALRTLGSIEQFKVFGPEEDRFEVEIDKVIGVGGQGTVYQCHRQSAPEKKYAVKTIPIWRLLVDPSSAEKIAAIEKEADVLLRVQGHPNIAECVGCYDAFRPGTSEAQYKMMVMELVSGGELAEVIKEKGRLNEDVARNVFRQCLEALKFMHGRQVLHRDLKCENILICGDELTKDTSVKLIDFGVAENINNIGSSCVGTMEIMAPELVRAKLMIAPQGEAQNTHGPYTFKAPSVEPPGFGIKSQRPDGKGAMVNGVEAAGQAADAGIGNGWVISQINGQDITEMPFIKDFNEIGAGTKAGVTAIAEILGGLSADFTMEFIEMPKREFSTGLDMWSLGVVLYVMLAGRFPFKSEAEIVEAAYSEEPLADASPEARQLISQLLVQSPAERLTAEAVDTHLWMAREMANA